MEKFSKEWFEAEDMKRRQACARRALARHQERQAGKAPDRRKPKPETEKKSNGGNARRRGPRQKLWDRPPLAKTVLTLRRENLVFEVFLDFDPEKSSCTWRKVYIEGPLGVGDRLLWRYGMSWNTKEHRFYSDKREKPAGLARLFCDYPDIALELVRWIDPKASSDHGSLDECLALM